MIGDSPQIDKFVHDYATSLEVMSLEEWGEKYGVHRNTVSKWIKDYNTDIEEICSIQNAEFNKNVQRLKFRAIDKLNDLFDAKSTFLTKNGEICESDNLNIQLGAVSEILKKTVPNQESMTLNAKIDKADDWVLELTKDNTDVTGGK
jgi:hypothetical protein